jgi:hypothetical protein
VVDGARVAQRSTTIPSAIRAEGQNAPCGGGSGLRYFSGTRRGDCLGGMVKAWSARYPGRKNHLVKKGAPQVSGVLVIARDLQGARVCLSHVYFLVLDDWQDAQHEPSQSQQLESQLVQSQSAHSQPAHLHSARLQELEADDATVEQPAIMTAPAASTANRYFFILFFLY